MGDTSGGSSRRRKWRDIPLSFTIVILLIIALFVSAGILEWTWGLVLAGIMIVNRIVTLFFLDPGLVQERTSFRQGYKNWDIILSTIMGRAAPFVIIVVSGFDHRFSWSRSFPLILRFLGLFLIIFAYALVAWAMKVNKFFSSIVRIQKDRGQYVILTGPYGIVRHPGYLATIIHTISLPLLLGSYWATIPAFVSIVLSFVRIVLEDNTLKRELEGYSGYTEKVRYRILPGVW